MSEEIAGMTACPCGDSYPSTSYDAGFIDGSGLCVNCDAAMGVDIPSRQAEIERLREALVWCREWFELHCPTSRLISGLQITHPMLASIRNALEAQQAQDCGACGDGCKGRQCRVKVESPPADHGADKLNMVMSLPIKILQDRELAAAESAGEEFFLDLPDSWYEPRPTYGCNNGHVSRTYLKSEKSGALCLECHASVAMLPHHYDTDAKLKAALDAIAEQQAEGE